jgi:hypothetical protein
MEFFSREAMRAPERYIFSFMFVPLRLFIVFTSFYLLFQGQDESLMGWMAMNMAMLQNVYEEAEISEVISTIKGLSEMLRKTSILRTPFCKVPKSWEMSKRKRSSYCRVSSQRGIRP